MKSDKFGVLSSVVASLCCVGPLVAVSLGLGGVGAAAFFGKTHWIWVTLGVALLAVGWTIHRKESQSGCKAGCDLSSTKRAREILLTSSVIVALFTGMNVWAHFVRTPSASTTTGGGRTVTIPVEGMVCVTCEIALENSLKDQPGILSVHADAKQKSTTVQYDPDATNMTSIIERIRASGYKAKGGE